MANNGLSQDLVVRLVNIDQTLRQLKNKIDNSGLKSLGDIKVNPQAGKELANLARAIAQSKPAFREAAGSLEIFGNSLQKVATGLRGAAPILNAYAGAMKVATNAQEKFNKEQGRTADFANEFGKQTGIAARRFGGFLIAQNIVSKLGLAFKEATSQAVGFEREIIRLAQFQNTTIKQAQQLGNFVGKLAIEFGTSSQSLVKSAQILAQAGRSTGEIRSILSALTPATLTASFSSLEGATESLNALLGQFNIRASDSTQVLDELNAVAEAFNVSIDELFDGLKRSGSAFAALAGVKEGVTPGTQALREYAAIFTAVIDTTREGSDTIGTALKTILPRLQRGENQSFLRNFGIELLDSDKNFVGPLEAIKRISAAMKDLSSQSPQFAAIVEKLGGERQFNRVLPLLQETTKIQRALDIAAGAGGSIAEDAALGQQALQVQLQKTLERFRELLRELTQSDTFKALAASFLGLANSAITLADSLRELVPLITTVATFQALRSIPPFSRGFAKGAAFGLPKAFNKGGLVPSILTPGELVFSPEAVKREGISKLRQYNATGNIGGMKSMAGTYVVPGTGNSDSVKMNLEEGSFVIKKKSVEKSRQGFMLGGSVRRQKYATGGGPVNLIDKLLERLKKLGVTDATLSGLPTKGIGPVSSEIKFLDDAIRVITKQLGIQRGVYSTGSPISPKGLATPGALLQRVSSDPQSISQTFLHELTHATGADKGSVYIPEFSKEAVLDKYKRGINARAVAIAKQQQADALAAGTPLSKKSVYNIYKKNYREGIIGLNKALPGELVAAQISSPEGGKLVGDATSRRGVFGNLKSNSGDTGNILLDLAQSAGRNTALTTLPDWLKGYPKHIENLFLKIQDEFVKSAKASGLSFKEIERQWIGIAKQAKSLPELTQVAGYRGKIQDINDRPGEHDAFRLQVAGNAAVDRLNRRAGKRGVTLSPADQARVRTQAEQEYLDKQTVPGDRNDEILRQQDLARVQGDKEAARLKRRADKRYAKAVRAARARKQPTPLRSPLSQDVINQVRDAAEAQFLNPDPVLTQRQANTQARRNRKVNYQPTEVINRAAQFGVDVTGNDPASLAARKAGARRYLASIASGGGGGGPSIFNRLKERFPNNQITDVQFGKIQAASFGLSIAGGYLNSSQSKSGQVAGGALTGAGIGLQSSLLTANPIIIALSTLAGAANGAAAAVVKFEQDLQDAADSDAVKRFVAGKSQISDVGSQLSRSASFDATFKVGDVGSGGLFGIDRLGAQLGGNFLDVALARGNGSATDRDKAAFGRASSFRQNLSLLTGNGFGGLISGLSAKEIVKSQNATEVNDLRNKFSGATEVQLDKIRNQVLKRVGRGQKVSESDVNNIVSQFTKNADSARLIALANPKLKSAASLTSDEEARSFAQLPIRTLIKELVAANAPLSDLGKKMAELARSTILLSEGFTNVEQSLFLLKELTTQFDAQISSSLDRAGGGNSISPNLLTNVFNSPRGLQPGAFNEGVDKLGERLGITTLGGFQNIAEAARVTNRVRTSLPQELFTASTTSAAYNLNNNVSDFLQDRLGKSGNSVVDKYVKDVISANFTGDSNVPLAGLNEEEVATITEKLARELDRSVSILSETNDQFNAQQQRIAQQAVAIANANQGIVRQQLSINQLNERRAVTSSEILGVRSPLADRNRAMGAIRGDLSTIVGSQVTNLSDLTGPLAAINREGVNASNVDQYTRLTEALKLLSTDTRVLDATMQKNNELNQAQQASRSLADRLLGGGPQEVLKFNQQLKDFQTIAAGGDVGGPRTLEALNNMEQLLQNFTPEQFENLTGFSRDEGEQALRNIRGEQFQRLAPGQAGAIIAGNIRGDGRADLVKEANQAFETMKQASEILKQQSQLQLQTAVEQMATQQAAFTEGIKVAFDQAFSSQGSLELQKALNKFSDTFGGEGASVSLTGKTDVVVSFNGANGVFKGIEKDLEGAISRIVNEQIKVALGGGNNKAGIQGANSP